MKQPVVRSFLGAALIGTCAFVSFGEGDVTCTAKPASGFQVIIR